MYKYWVVYDHGHSKSYFLLINTCNMPYLCLECRRQVRKNSKAVECDQCKEWCHIRCGVPITEKNYQLLTKGQITFDWSCPHCAADEIQPRSDLDQTIASEDPSIPIAESSRFDTTVTTADTSEAATTTAANDSLYAQDLGSFTQPQPQDESNIEHPDITPRHIDEEHECTYEIVESATSRGKVCIGLHIVHFDNLFDNALIKLKSKY